MTRLGIKFVDLVKAAAGCDIYFAADDGMDSFSFASPIEINGTVHCAVVGDSHRRLTQFFYAFGKITDAARTVQKAVFRMDMQMRK